MAEPRNLNDARRILREADLATPAGRTQAQDAIKWLSQRPSVPDDVQRLVDATVETLVSESLGLDSGLGTLGGQLRAIGGGLKWLWEGNVKAGDAVIDFVKRGWDASAPGTAGEALGGTSPSTREARRDAPDTERELIASMWQSMTESQKRRARTRGLAPEQPVTGPPRPSDEWLAESVARGPQREGEGPAAELNPQMAQLAAMLQSQGVENPEAAAQQLLAGNPPAGELVQRLAAAMPDIPPDMLQGLAEQFAGPGFIGVPDTHARTEQGPPGVSARREGMPESVWKARPRYRQGAQHRPLQWSSERIADLQRRLVKAGLLEGDFHYGWYDDATGGAYEMALSAANQRAIDVWDALDNLARDRAEQLEDQRAQAMAGFQARPFLPSDPAAVEERVREAMTSFLGREPDPEELDDLAARFGSLERAQHRMETELERRQHSSMVEQEFAQATAMPGEVVESSPIDVTGLRQVDPAHALMAEIRKRYAPERGHIEAVGEFADQDQNLMSTLLGLDAVIGGG